MRVWSSHGHNTLSTTTLLQMMLPLCLAVLLCPLGLVRGQGENQTQSPTQVLQDLLARFGDNTTITVPQLRSLLALLSQGQGEGESESNVADTPTAKPPKANRSKCLPEDTLAIYSISEQSRLDGQGLRELCPTMLQQLDAGTCRAQKQEELSVDPSLRPTDAEVWGFAFLSVTVINAFSLTGIFIVPLLKTHYMKYILSFFIALAIGTLYSTSILQLLPECGVMGSSV